MAIFNKEGLLVTKKSKYQIDDVVDKLSFIQGTYLVDFLQSIGLSIPRKLRMNVLTEVLNDSVERTVEERKSLADEMGYRLTWFSRFTDSQLVNLLEWYQSNALGNHFLHGFWKELIKYMVVKGVGDDDLERLFNEANDAFKTNKRPVTKEFNKALNAALYDENGEIDGVTISQFRPVTYKATTLTELRSIGDKYNAPIPKRLKKIEMLEVILDKLKERNELTPDLEKKLNTQNIILLERFAKDHDIKVSTELKKEEIIEYILSNAEETKSSYFVPQSQEVYEDADAPLVQKSTQKLEPVVEPKPIVIERIVESIPSTPKVLVNTEQIDYRPQIEKLAEAFNKLAQSFEQKEFSVKIENYLKSEAPAQVEQVTKYEAAATKQQAATPSNLLVSQEVLIQELLKEDDSDAPELNPATNFPIEGEKVVKEFTYKKGVGLLAALFALIFSVGFAWVYLLALGLLIAPFLIEANQMFADLEPTMQLVVTYGSVTFAVLNLLTFLRLLMKPKKKELLAMGIVTLFSGVLITGLLVFASIGSKTKEVVQVQTNETVRLAEAIEKINTPSKGKKVNKTSGFMRVFMRVFFILITLVLLVFVIIYGIWRLDFTYGYENIPMIGPFLRDSIIEPLFGSAHDISRYNV